MDSQEGGARIKTYTDGYDTYCAISEHLWDLELFKSKDLVQPGTCRLSSADMKVRKRDRERNMNMRESRERGREKETEKEISCLYTLVIVIHAMWGIWLTHHGVNLLRSLPSSSASLFLRPMGSHQKGTSRQHWADKPSKNKRSGSVCCKKWSRAKAMLSQKILLDIHSGLQRRERKVNVVARRESATFSTNSSARATWNSSQGDF